MSNKPSLDDYIDVAERILKFKEKHPEGSLQTIDWSVQTIGERTFVVYRAAAYRTPDDERPGHGTAWEPFPGPTQFTRDSELMNAETAAWGRAIVAVGLAASKKIASRQEVKARQGENGASTNGDASALATPADVKEMVKAAEGLGSNQILLCLGACGLNGVDNYGLVPREKVAEFTKKLAAMERKS